MSAGLDASPGRRAARWVAPVGLCGGAVCLLVGAAVYLGAAPDVPPATSAKDLALAAVAVLGTMLVSVGAVFALLDRIGVPAAGTVQRHGVEALEPRHDLPASAWRSAGAAHARNNPTEAPLPLPDHEAGSMGAGGAAPSPAVRGTGDGETHRGPMGAGGAVPPRGAPPDDDAGARTTLAPGPGAPGESIRGAEPSESGAAEPGPRSGHPAGTHPGVPSPELRAPVHETAAPPLPVDEPPLEPPRPGDLIDAWDDYRRNGDGHFSPRGLQEMLDQWGLDANVDHGDRVGAGGAVLIVETFGTRNFYVLPSFNKSPRAITDWFDDNSGGALTARTQRVTRLAQGRWLEPETAGGGRFEVLGRGEVR